MDEKKISVIVPVYNVESYLDKCIDSLINQSYRNLEIILVDDGSTDKSGLVCDKYQKIDDRIIVVHKNNGGLSSARNAGLKIAKGDLISFIDSDDYIEKDMFLELKNNMNGCKSDISICNIYYIKNCVKTLINSSLPDSDSVFTGEDKFVKLKDNYSSIMGYAWNKLYKKEIFDNIKFPEGKLYEYLFIICEILDAAKKISFTSKPLYNYVFRSSSIGNSFSKKHFDLIESSNAKIDFFEKNNYFDLAVREKNIKMNNLLIIMSKMKRYGIKDKEIEKKYYQELVNTNKEVKWKGATKYNKFYKIFRKSSISILAFMLKVRDRVKR